MLAACVAKANAVADVLLVTLMLVPASDPVNIQSVPPTWSALNAASASVRLLLACAVASDSHNGTMNPASRNVASKRVVIGHFIFSNIPCPSSSRAGDIYGLVGLRLGGSGNPHFHRAEVAGRARVVVGHVQFDLEIFLVRPERNREVTRRRDLRHVLVVDLGRG